MKGNKGLTLTGHLGDVMEESTNAIFENLAMIIISATCSRWIAKPSGPGFSNPGRARLVQTDDQGRKP